MKELFLLIYALFGIAASLGFIAFTKKDPNNEKRWLGLALLIAAGIYILFAMVWGNWNWVLIEIVGVLIYSVFYFLGKRFAFLWIGVGWLLHPIWDFGLHWLSTGKMIAPEWYTISCITFDVIVAFYIFSRKF